MTRIVGKIYENTKEIKENNLRGAAAPRRGAAGGSAFVFFIFLSIFVYFANNPSHWDGNPGIGIVNPNNPSSGRGLDTDASSVSTKLDSRLSASSQSRGIPTPPIPQDPHPPLYPRIGRITPSPYTPGSPPPRKCGLAAARSAAAGQRQVHIFWGMGGWGSWGMGGWGVLFTP